MAIAFFKGQQLGRNDLNIFLVGANGTPVDAAEISYALYDFTTSFEVLVGGQQRNPGHPSMGEYYASVVVPLDANIGNYRIRWTFREVVGGPIQQVVQEFEVIDKVASGDCIPVYTGCTADLIRRFRIMLRDHNPDRNYHFRPPAHEETIRQYNKVFGYIWEDYELGEFIERSLDMIVASPPRTPFTSVDQLCQSRPEWRTMLLTGGMIYALNALRLNWIADEFDYSIGGISLSLDRSSKYESAMSSASEQFDKQLEKAKATVNIIRGLQQPRFGVGIRSAFGPFVGRGVLTPRKFMGV
jgi:hypothetical protein